MELVATAQMLVNRQDPEANSTIEWLVDFAAQLAGKLGLNMGEAGEMSGDEEFFLELLQAVADSKGDGQIVHQFFDEHLANLNANLLAIFPQQAEMLLGRQDDPDWKSFVASKLVDLGVDLDQFSRGNRGLNLELAIACYDRALLEYTREKLPLDWAMTQMNRATVYRNRIEGDKRENLEAAIRGYDRALLEYTREKLPLEWATTQMNRAIVYQNRIEGDKRENLEEAIRGYDRALLEYTREKLPLDWAMTQMNRANVYRNRIEGDKRENLEEAIRGYDLALLEHTREKLPLEWATTQMNRATVYQERIEGDKRENLEAAIRGYKAALEIRTIAALPIPSLNTSRALGNIYFKQGAWQSAIIAYETAMQAVETSRSWVVNEETRQQLLTDALSVYENAIQCAINLKNYPQAIQYTERIRSRQLVDLMGTPDLYPDAQIPAEITTYLDEYKRLDSEIQNLREYGSPDSNGTKSTRNEVALRQDTIAILALQQQKKAIYLKIREFDPALSGQLQIDPIDFTTIQQLITTPHTAILTCYTTDDDTHIFIIKQGQPPTIHTCKGQGWSQLQQWLRTKWVIPYHTTNTIWQQNLPTLLAEISHRLQLDTLISNHLTDITELIIVPHLNLHQIPFAALPVAGTGGLGDGLALRCPELAEGSEVEVGAGGRGDGGITLSSHTPHTPPTEASNPNPLLGGVPEGRGGSNPLLGGVPEGRGGFLLGDKFIIRSIPSCQILQYCQQRKPITTKHIGTVEDAQDNLLGARYEGEQIAALYSIPTANRLRGSSQATVANYRELLTRINRFHSSHHAVSNPNNPLESALILANGERITLGDLLLGKRYPDTLDEVFLSACETHVGTATLTDDVATLTTGFLCIGARSVQRTLWSVDDLVTALFDIFYHQERREGVSRVEALKAAQVRLRYLTGEEFKISHYPRLKAFIDANLPLTRDRLEARMDELDLAKQTATPEAIVKIDAEYSQLDDLLLKINRVSDTLQKYCQQQQPFESPYYWAAFICQGMA